MTALFMRRTIWLLAMLLAACGGSQAISTNPVVPGASTLPAQTFARFTITVPAAAGTASHTRAPKYVSSATQSVIITLTNVNGVAYTGSQARLATNLTPSNSACSSAGTNLTCTVNAPAIVGTDSFSVVTYDAQQTTSSPATPAGNVLSEATLAVNVVAGQANQPTTPLILGGVAASYLTTLPSDPHVRGSQGAGYQIAGNWQYVLNVTPVDADGNVIIGPGTPTVSVQSGGSAVAVTPGSSANTFAVQTKSYSATPVVLTINAPLGSSTTVSVSTVQELWVTNSGTETVNAYALYPGTAPVALPDEITTGLINPTGITFDASGDLWVASRSNTFVYEYAPQTLALIQGLSTAGAVTQMAFDAAGDLWTADNNGNLIQDRVPPISETSPAHSAVTGTLPFGLAIDSNQNVWVSTTNGGGTITEFSSATLTAVTTISDPHTPYGLAFDGSRNLWVANDATSSVSEYAPPYTGAPTTISTVASPIGIAFDFSGNLWVVGAGSVSEYSPPTFAATTTITDANIPFFVAFTP
jgi:sugar lactone lactonase YvrE